MARQRPWVLGIHSKYNICAAEVSTIVNKIDEVPDLGEFKFQ